MATKMVEKTGVYRNDAGHSVFLRKGEQASDVLLTEYKLDSAASKDYAKEPERSYFSSVIDAPQDRDHRSQGAAPENRMEPPVSNRTDAQLAADAAKQARADEAAAKKAEADAAKQAKAEAEAKAKAEQGAQS